MGHTIQHYDYPENADKKKVDVDGHELFVFVPFNPDSDICAKAVRIIEKYLNVNAFGENVMRCIRALVEAADIDSLINN